MQASPNLINNCGNSKNMPFSKSGKKCKKLFFGLVMSGNFFHSVVNFGKYGIFARVERLLLFSAQDFLHSYLPVFARGGTKRIVVVKRYIVLHFGKFRVGIYCLKFGLAVFLFPVALCNDVKTYYKQYQHNSA